MFDVNLARDGDLVFERIVRMKNKNFVLGLATLALSISKEISRKEGTRD
jgi:hypothetical protein